MDHNRKIVIQEAVVNQSSFNKSSKAVAASSQKKGDGHQSLVLQSYNNDEDDYEDMVTPTDDEGI